MWSQIAIWEALEPAAGRPTRRPWGCPISVWRAACKRWERQQAPNPHSAIAEVIERARLRPWPIAIGTAPRAKQKVVIRPAAECSPAFARMVQAGRIPGHQWESGVGVVRWI